jgi:hypothetical protein
MFGDNGHAVRWVLGEQQGCGQARHASPVMTGISLELQMELAVSMYVPDNHDVRHV